jgi:hypothetical protein
MKKRLENAITYLAGGLGLIIILGGVFALYSPLYGLIGALLLWVTIGALKRSWTAVLGSIGLIVLFASIFGFYPLVYGVFGAIVIWIISGTLHEYKK